MLIVVTRYTFVFGCCVVCVFGLLIGCLIWDLCLFVCVCGLRVIWFVYLNWLLVVWLDCGLLLIVDLLVLCCFRVCCYLDIFVGICAVSVVDLPLGMLLGWIVDGLVLFSC